MSSSSSDLDDNYHALCMAVGHLFITFARLEGTLTTTLKLHLAHNLDGEAPRKGVALASAIYGSVRFKTARDSVKRIATAEKLNQQTYDFFLRLMEQAAHIETFRDMIAHHIVVPTGDPSADYWQVTDALATRDIGNPKVYVFSAFAVACAADDLVAITARIGDAVTGQLILGHLTDLSPITWRYMPSMLKLVPRNKVRNPLRP